MGKFYLMESILGINYKAEKALNSPSFSAGWGHRALKLLPFLPPDFSLRKNFVPLASPKT